MRYAQAMIVWRIALPVGGGACLAILVNAILPLPPSGVANWAKQSDVGYSEASVKNNKDRGLRPALGGETSIPPDWQQRENRLEFAVAVAGRQGEQADEIANLASIQSLLSPFEKEPRNATLMGFALGFGFASNPLSIKRGELPGEIDRSEISLRFLLPGILSTREREPNPLPLFGSVSAQLGKNLSTGTILRKELCDLCLWFSAESGRLDPDKSIDLVVSQPDNLDKLGAPKTGALLQLIEKAAVLSPLTFQVLLQRLGEKYPKLLVDVVSEADFPSEAMAALVKSLPKKIKEELARRLCKRVLNGTLAEIEKVLACFPNPAELPTDIAANLSVAISLLGAQQLNGWLEKLDTKQRSQVFEQIGNLRFAQLHRPAESQVQMWELRLDNILNTASVRTELAAQFEKLSLLVSLDCNGPQSLPVLQTIANELRGKEGAKEREIRETILKRFYSIKWESEGSESLVAVIQNSPASGRSTDQDIARHVLVIRNRERAQQLQRETSDPALALQLDENLIEFPDLSQTYAQNLDAIRAHLPKTQLGEITPGTAKAVEKFVGMTGYLNRPMAVTLINDLPEGDLRQNMMKVLASNWSKDDPVGASEWLATLPASSARDIAINELVEASHDDPEMGLANAVAITDPVLRLKSATSVVSRWKDVNSSFIEDLVYSSSLSSEEKGVLAKTIKATAAAESFKSIRSGFEGVK
jgi:hypothetical protein